MRITKSDRLLLAVFLQLTAQQDGTPLAPLSPAPSLRSEVADYLCSKNLLQWKNT